LSKDNNKTSETKTTKKSEPFWKDLVEIALFLGIAVLLIIGFNWVLGLVLHTDTPLVTVTSESMEPTYYGSNRPKMGGTLDIRKDMLIIKGEDPKNIQVGDTIVFNRKNNKGVPIVHRVVAKYFDEVNESYYFTTKGDNNLSFFGEDDPAVDDEGDVTYPYETIISEDRIIGKVIGRIGYLGGVFNFFQNRTGQIVLIVAIGVILLATFLFSGSEDEDENIFSEPDETKNKTIGKNEKTDEKPEQNDTKINFKERLKKFRQFYRKNKNFIIPSLILGIIILVPIIDTLNANWGSHFGVIKVEHANNIKENHVVISLQNGIHDFVHLFVTINNPGHWHQEFVNFEIKIINQSTDEILGSNNWSCVYNFEGQKMIKTGAFVEHSQITKGESYLVRVTANLGSKFGKTWTDTLSTTIIYNYETA
jgi:signal peptidase I